MSVRADEEGLRGLSSLPDDALSASEHSACGCLPKRDRPGWHRYRGLPLCDAAHAQERRKGRAKYERSNPDARPYRPRPMWHPGAEILLEDDAL